MNDAWERAGVVPPCAICGHCGRGEPILRHLTHGVAVWLCSVHGADRFLGRASGYEFVERISSIWAASGVLTSRRRQALTTHIRRLEQAGTVRSRPGSYSWPRLRQEAERRFAAGEPPAEVITELRAAHAEGPATAPSLRTMRRWFTEGRWLACPAPKPTGRATRARPRRAGRAHPLVELILTGYGYPAFEPAPRASRGP